MEEGLILEMLKEWRINSEEALESLSGLDHTPIIVRDRDKGWAVVMDNQSKAKLKRRTEETIISLTVGKELWKKSIREALIYTLGEIQNNNSG